MKMGVVRGMPVDAIIAGKYVSVLTGRMLQMPSQANQFGAATETIEREDESFNGHMFLVLGVSLPYALLKRIHPLRAQEAHGLEFQRIGPFNMAMPSIQPSSSIITLDLRHFELSELSSDYVVAVQKLLTEAACTVVARSSLLPGNGAGCPAGDTDEQKCENCAFASICPFRTRED